MKLTLCIVGVVAATTLCGCASQRTVATAEPAVAEDSVTQIVPLQHWSAEAALHFFVVHDVEGPSVSVDPRTNSLILRGKAEDVEKLRLTLEQIDRPC